MFLKRQENTNVQRCIASYHRIFAWSDEVIGEKNNPRDILQQLSKIMTENCRGRISLHILSLSSGTNSSRVTRTGSNIFFLAIAIISHEPSSDLRMGSQQTKCCQGHWCSCLETIPSLNSPIIDHFTLRPSSSFFIRSYHWNNRNSRMRCMWVGWQPSSTPWTSRSCIGRRASARAGTQRRSRYGARDPSSTSSPPWMSPAVRCAESQKVQYLGGRHSAAPPLLLAGPPVAAAAAAAAASATGRAVPEPVEVAARGRKSRGRAGGSGENKDGADGGIETKSDNEIMETTQASSWKRGKSQSRYPHFGDFLVMLVDIFHLLYLSHLLYLWHIKWLIMLVLLMLLMLLITCMSYLCYLSFRCPSLCYLCYLFYLCDLSRTCFIGHALVL